MPDLRPFLHDRGNWISAVARKGSLSVEKEDVDQVRDHFGVFGTASLFVLTWIPIQISSAHAKACAFLHKMHDIDAKARPAAMEVQGVVCPINEPLIEVDPICWTVGGPV